MAGSTVSVNSAEIALTSGVGSHSALKMKAAYLQPVPGADREPISRHPHPGRERPGPNATVYLTMVAGRTRAGDIKNLLIVDPGMRTGDYYTLTFVAGVHLDDPVTTRFINATISLEMPGNVQIPEYSPKEKEVIAALAESGSCGISVTPLLGFMAIQAPGPAAAGPVHHVSVRQGPERQFPGTFSGKNGFQLMAPPGFLLEYQGMRKNEHAVDWELYPPMIPRDGEYAGKENLAVFSLIVHTPGRGVPPITVRVEGRVKGDLWGVIHLNGSVTFPLAEK